ncbi:hypothetical protein [Labilibaculum euxinus]
MGLATILGVGEVGGNRHLNPGPSPRGEGSLLKKKCFDTGAVFSSP